MPPQLALIICTIFVLWLLHLDYKKVVKVSFASWILTIWMLLNYIKPLSYWFGFGGGMTMEEGSPLNQSVLTGLFCFGLLILIKRKFNWSDAIRQNSWVMVLIGYMFISILWSNMPFVSFKRWTRELIAVVMAFVLITECEPRRTLESIFRRIVYLLIPLSYILIHYFPEYGREYQRHSGTLMWVGVATHKSGLGLLCLFSGFFLVWTLIRRWQGRDKPVVKYQSPVEFFLLFMTIWLLMGPNHSLTYSSASTAALIIGLTFLIFLLSKKKRGKLINSGPLMILVSIIIVYGTIAPFIGRLPLYDVASVLGREKTLTGRSDIWEFLVPLAMQKPILGHGFGGFWTSEKVEAALGNSHNGYLDLILNLGFVGHILFSMFLLAYCREARKTMVYDLDWGAFGICFLLIGTAHNIAENSIVGFTESLSAVILFMAVYFSVTSSKSSESVVLKTINNL